MKKTKSDLLQAYIVLITTSNVQLFYHEFFGTVKYTSLISRIRRFAGQSIISKASAFSAYGLVVVTAEAIHRTHKLEYRNSKNGDKKTQNGVSS